MADVQQTLISSRGKGMKRCSFWSGFDVSLL